ncbi:MAG: TRAP transporter substrate-binding protein DctP [Spirochaetales bacterium]|nr:TRAP transporter substrate-binding protein DctP [Spirochaetales bacterium]
MISKRFLTAFFILLLLPAALYSQEIKLGTTIPPGSPWDYALQELSNRWSDLSGGRYRLRPYMGGIAGTEEDMIRKTRIGHLQAVVLTGSGLSDISSDTLALSLPLFIQSEEELSYLLEKMNSRLNALLEEKGFTVIAWQRAGWLRIFSKHPAATPADLRTHKLALPIENNTFQQIWRSMGFNIVSLSSNDFLTGLQTGMVDAIVSAPLMAAAYQWFPLAPNMMDVAFAPLLGALLIDTRVWNRIPADLRAEMLQAAQEILTPVEEQIMALEAEAVALMRGMNVRVVPVPEPVMREWRDVSSRGYHSIIGTTVSRELYSEMEALLTEFRQSKER